MMLWAQRGDSEELQIAEAAVQQYSSAAGIPFQSYSRTNDWGAVCERLQKDAVRWLFLAQPRRGAWRQEHCEQAHRANPLAGLFGVHGSWCEGWQRTGEPWHGVEHLYWHQLPMRLPTLVSRPPLLRTAATSAGPVLSGQPSQAPPVDAVVIVSSASVTGHASLVDLVESTGRLACDARHPLEHAPVQATIWEGDVRDSSDRRRLEALREDWQHVPCLAVTLAPRLEDWQAITSHATAVLTKPFVAADFYNWLEAVDS